MKKTDILDVFNNKRYARLAVDLNKQYRKNLPFPHIAIDNFLPKKIALDLSKEYAIPNYKKKKWKYHFNNNVKRYLLEDIDEFSSALKYFAYAINGRSFLSFLETITGDEHLIPDPYFMGGGAMATGKGGFLKIHLDYNFHHKLQSWRRVNALFYLNKNWKKEWGGNLILENNSKSASIEPKFNRLVIFTLSKNSFHGQPEPLNCPKNQFRNVFSSFYYTSKNHKDMTNKPHFTLYDIKKSPYANSILKNYQKK